MIVCGRRCERLNDDEPSCEQCGAGHADNPPLELDDSNPRGGTSIPIRTMEAFPAIRPTSDQAVIDCPFDDCFGRIIIDLHIQGGFPPRHQFRPTLQVIVANFICSGEHNHPEPWIEIDN